MSYLVDVLVANEARSIFFVYRLLLVFSLLDNIFCSILPMEGLILILIRRNYNLD